MAGKRKILSILGGLGLLLFLALTGVCYWVMATSGGSAWLIRTAADRLPGKIAVQSVEGRLTDEIILSGLDIGFENGNVNIGRLTWRWRAAGLLHRNVRIRTLHLEDVTLATIPEEDKPTEPLDLGWPALPDWITGLHISLDDLQIRRFTWKQPDTRPFYLEGLATEVRWARRKLRIPRLTALCEAGALTAKAQIDWRRPGLQLRATSLVRPGTGTDIPLVLTLALKPGEQTGTLEGTLHAGGHAPTIGGVRLNTPFVLAPTDLKLDGFALEQLAATGVLLGKLTLDWAEPKPRLELSADLKNLDLTAMANRTTDLSGSLSLSAGPETYKGDLSLHNRAKDWQNLRLKTAFHGDRQQLTLAGIELSGFGGLIGGEGSVRWEPDLEIRASLTGKNLNPAGAGLAWPGNINLQAEGSWSRPDRGDMTAAVRARLLPSTLRGYPLRGRVEGRLQGEDVLIDGLELHSRGVEVTAKGRLQQRIDFAAGIDDLAGLMPELSGALQGRGWIRWRNRQIAGRVNGSGSALRHGQLAIQNLLYRADLEENRSGFLDLTLAGIKNNGLEIPALSIRGNGRPDRHSLSARITLPRKAHLNLAAEGGYKKAAWQGMLTEVTLRDAIGSLSLTAPAALSVSQKTLDLAPLRLKGTTGEELTAAADIRFSPLGGSAKLGWDKLRLAHAQAWMGGAEITGNSSGSASWRQDTKESFELLAGVRAAGLVERDGRRLDLAGLDAGVSWTPARLQADLGLVLKAGGRLEGSLRGGRSASLSLPEKANWQLLCRDLDLQQFSAWLPVGFDIRGILSGQSRGEWLTDRKLVSDGNLTITGGQFITEKEQSEITVPVKTAKLSWDQRGKHISIQTDIQQADYGRLSGNLSLDLKEEGRLDGNLQGEHSPYLALFEQANWQLACRDLDLQQFSAWLPAGMDIRGMLAGRSGGEWLANRQLVSDGNLTIAGGQFIAEKDRGKITVPLRTADLNWNWRGEHLSGQTDIKLGEFGRLNGSFRLPVPARFPVEPEKNGTLAFTIDGRSSELGLLTALMPGAVQETRGHIEIALRGSGTWAEPRFNGEVRLLDAGAYLPIAGLELQQVKILAHLDKDRILLDNLSLQSGKGTLQAKGSLQLHDLKPGNYDITLKGQGVQLVNLPELQVVADPDLRITGSASELKVTGSVRLPDVMIRDNKKPSVITPSEDVVIVGVQTPEKRTSDFQILADIRLLLGDHVLIKSSGLDARLTGELRLTAIGADALTSRGRISVAEGLYAAYGTRLDITRGNLLFNGPIDQPTLDIVALRTVGKIKAGVQVSGTPRVPVVKLTSEPAMSDSDRLAYIILGRASARNAGEADLLMTAGGLLLSQGESVVLRDRLKRQLGIDVLGFEAGSATGTGQEEISGSMLTIGKYLSPSLYVSIGQSLFANTQEFRLRYSLGTHWELESTTGEESGVDLFYKIEFR
jgi:autotransporter translocation and assembly factor TamB